MTEGPTMHSRLRLCALLAPCAEREFFERHWGERPLCMRARHACLEPLLAIFAKESLQSLVGRAVRPITVSRRKDPSNATCQAVGSHALGYYEANRAVTLYLVAMDAALPALRDAVVSLGADLGISHLDGAAEASLLASSRGGGFDFHFDKNENFIVQLSGVKRWRMAPNQCVRRPTVNFSEDPIEELSLYGAGQLAKPRSWEEIDLQPGDVLYMPRGYWHETEALTKDSLSLSLTFLSVTWADAILPYLRRLLIRQESWRAHAALNPTGRNREELVSLLESLPRVADELREELLAGPELPPRESQRFSRRSLASTRVESNAGERRLVVLLPTFGSIRRSELQVEVSAASALDWILAQSDFSRADLSARFPELPASTQSALLVGLQSAGALRSSCN